MGTAIPSFISFLSPSVAVPTPRQMHETQGWLSLGFRISLCEEHFDWSAAEVAERDRARADEKLALRIDAQRLEDRREQVPGLHFTVRDRLAVFVGLAPDSATLDTTTGQRVAPGTREVIA